MSPVSNKMWRIGIVGGSIAGCAAATIFRRAGHDVTIFEQSSAPLRGRGGGISTTPSMLHDLVEARILLRPIANILSSSQPLVGQSPDGNPYGRIPATLPIALAACDWGALQRQLRAQVPDACYWSGLRVTAIRPEGRRFAIVELGDGQFYDFDLVVAADGIDSLGRRTLFPETVPEYRGYILWRGTLPEQMLSESGPLVGKRPRISNAEGHAVFYLAPGGDGTETTPGNRVVSWGMYVTLGAEDLPDFMATDLTIQEARMKALARDTLPSYYAGIIEASEKTAFQPIFGVQPPGYYQGRICLLGDAGTIVPPFTGSGVIKSIHSARSLVEAIAHHTEMDEALAAWEREQSTLASHLTQVAGHMEKLLIWRIPDFGTIGRDTARTWLKRLANVPYARTAD